MRPGLLNPLFAAASSLRGVGGKLERTLAKLVRTNGHGADGARVVDLLWHLPSGVIDRSRRPAIAALPEEGVVTVEVTVARHVPPPSRRAPYRVECTDETGVLTLVFFHPHVDYLLRILPVGEKRYVSGRVDWFSGTPQIVHPDYVVAPDEFAELPLVEPVYPMTAGLSPKVLRKAIHGALEVVPDLTEWQDAHWLERQGWPGFNAALAAVHEPGGEADLLPSAPARARLAYDELLANQLALALVRRRLKKAAGRSVSGDGHLRAKVAAALPYSLTGAQEGAIADILRDMAAGERMLRLLQGDVGSGKTAVALIALAAAVEAGTQGAFMAPTEILARQHLDTLRPICEAAGMTVEVLTGREGGKARAGVLDRLASGETQIAIGTHALFQDDVAFADLGLVVIDEQHRFGVHQRLALQNKAAAGADMLVMTATPIPRTLSLTLYGDMDVSRLTEKPAGRQPVETRALPFERVGAVMEGLRRAIDGGARAYWVCPLVEESDKSELMAVEARYAALSELFPGRVGLVHGRMKGPEKDEVMARFQSGDIAILVATTVIEVGVNVPEATIMVIENAERFGLSQLHQLRGRVGRGTERSSCVLLYQGPLGETAAARLKIMRDTEDGFVIAEEDLRLRGAGELLGTRQSGMPTFKVASLELHGDLLAAARDDAGLILSRDPDLSTARGEALRTLLYLFERDEAVRTLKAG